MSTERVKETTARRLEWMMGRVHRKTRSGPTEDEINGLLEDAAALLRAEPVGEPVGWHRRWVELTKRVGQMALAKGKVTRDIGFALLADMAKVEVDVPLYAAPPAAPEAKNPDDDASLAMTPEELEAWIAKPKAWRTTPILPPSRETLPHSEAQEPERGPSFFICPECWEPLCAECKESVLRFRRWESSHGLPPASAAGEEKAERREAVALRRAEPATHTGEPSLYDIAAQADPSHAWHIPTPDGVCRRCGYDATDPEAREPCRGAALRTHTGELEALVRAFEDSVIEISREEGHRPTQRYAAARAALLAALRAQGGGE